MSMGTPLFISKLKFSCDKYSVDKVWTKIYCHFYFRGITLRKEGCCGRLSLVFSSFIYRIMKYLSVRHLCIHSLLINFTLIAARILFPLSITNNHCAEKSNKICWHGNTLWLFAGNANTEAAPAQAPRARQTRNSQSERVKTTKSNACVIL